MDTSCSFSWCVTNMGTETVHREQCLAVAENKETCFCLGPTGRSSIFALGSSAPCYMQAMQALETSLQFTSTSYCQQSNSQTSLLYIAGIDNVVTPAWLSHQWFSAARACGDVMFNLFLVLKIFLPHCGSPAAASKICQAFSSRVMRCRVY